MTSAQAKRYAKTGIYSPRNPTGTGARRMNKIISSCKSKATPIGKRIKIETVCTIRRKSK
jgi:hypothetical protein